MLNLMEFLPIYNNNINLHIVRTLMSDSIIHHLNVGPTSNVIVNKLTPTLTVCTLFWN